MMTKNEIAALQREINKTTGFNLTVDGRYGPKTEEAYQYYINQRTPASVETPVPLAPKPWWTSRSIWGLLATILAGIAGRSGYVVDAEGLTNVLLQVVEVGGLLLAFYGTVKRTAPVDGTLVAPMLRIPTGAPIVQPKSETDISHLRGPFGY